MKYFDNSNLYLKQLLIKNMSLSINPDQITNPKPIKIVQFIGVDQFSKRKKQNSRVNKVITPIIKNSK